MMPRAFKRCYPSEISSSETAVQERNKTAAHVNTMKLLNVTLEGSQKKCSVSGEKHPQQQCRKQQILTGERGDV